MRTSTIVWILVALVIILGLGWYFLSANNANAPTITTQTNQGSTGTNTSTSASGGAGATQPASTLMTSNTALGPVLVGQNEMTLYTYAPDTANKSNCTGQCAANWPPYTISAGTQLVPNSVLTGTLATITRADGSLQVTYNGHPLYFYIKDQKPGDTVGQGVGGVWYVVKP